MKKILLTITFALLTGASVQASSSQMFKPLHKFGIGLELLGQGFLYSGKVHYRPFQALAVNLGYSYLSVDDGAGTKVKLQTIPVSVSGLFFGDDYSYHNLEAVVGLTFLPVKLTSASSTQLTKLTDTALMYAFGIGYKYWPTTSGLIFGATLYGLLAGGDFIPWLGLELGYSF